MVVEHLRDLSKLSTTFFTSREKTTSTRKKGPVEFSVGWLLRLVGRASSGPARAGHAGMPKAARWRKDKAPQNASEAAEICRQGLDAYEWRTSCY